ncbi:MAG: RdgB/HAM1 family non-canonical purine NTP pyrophosphatase [Firmicutes bacterium]|nr:RdgB/HAM1 family non-canonical purine NTP pyrophosphatase [Bacillota bacterium]
MRFSEIVAATSNVGKLKEFQAILGGGVTLIPLSQSGFCAEIEETGKTFLENALIKAKAVYEFTKKPALADDSGLCVEALDGAPGVYSARYARDDATDFQNIDLLLKNLTAVQNRRAKFAACVVLYYTAGQYLTGFGETHGEILLEPQGTQGFGYDPVFYSYQLNKSFGLASAEEKNKVSHRAAALTDLLKQC